MRTIKFKGWHRKNNQMIDLQRLTPLQQSEPIPGLFLPSNPDIILLQCSGLLDSYGTEIYEGDILLSLLKIRPNQKGFTRLYNEVVFRDGCFGINGETGLFCNDLNEYCTETTVSGNIYQHRHLLDLNDVADDD